MEKLNFAAAFKAAMDQSPVKGKQLADAYGCHPQTISAIRSGVSSPSIVDFAQLLQTYESLEPGFIHSWACSLLGAAAIIYDDSTESQKAQAIKDIASSFQFGDQVAA